MSQKEFKKIFCFLEKNMQSEALEEFSKTLYTELDSYHFSLGLWIRNNIIRKDEKIKTFFHNIGIKGDDDISHVIIILFFFYIKLAKK